MEYRDIKYEYKTWLTYTGEFADCFSCSDKRLLKDVSDYVEMCTSNLDDMHSKIDYYLDNKAKLSRYEKVKKTIVSTFYETLNYKGD
jgi:hypothetical protein